MAEILMPTYPKINGVYKRYLEGPEKGRFIDGVWADPTFRYLADLPWVWKEKIDGTNIRLGWDPDVVMDTVTLPQLIGGRTNKAQIPTPLYVALEDLMLTMPLSDLEFADQPFTLYGEGYGPGIQKGGGLYRDTPGFILFDVKVGKYWLEPFEVKAVAEQLGIDTVPILGVCSLRAAIARIEAGMWQSTWIAHELEGVVGRPEVQLINKWGAPVITKVKTVDFR